MIEKHHHFSLPADLVEEQVTQLVMHLHIPPEWHERIMAYYLSHEGLGEFERKGYALRKELDRLKELYLGGHISKLEFDKDARSIVKELESLQPSSRPEAARILHLLSDWPSIWENMNGLEIRAVAGVVFDGLYFDQHRALQRAQAFQPFDGLLSLS